MRKNKGITLIALVITIIVMLILVAVSINYTIGENGIITNAKRAKEEMNLAKSSEEMQLEELLREIDLNKAEVIKIRYGEIRNNYFKYLKEESKFNNISNTGEIDLLVETIVEHNGKVYEAIVKEKKVNLARDEWEYLYNLEFDVYLIKETYIGDLTFVTSFRNEESGKFNTIYVYNDSYYVANGMYNEEITEDYEYYRIEEVLKDGNINNIEPEFIAGVVGYREKNNKEIETVSYKTYFSDFILVDFNSGNIMEAQQDNGVGGLAEQYDDLSKSNLKKYLYSDNRKELELVEGNIYKITENNEILFNVELINSDAEGKEYSLGCINNINNINKDRIIGVLGYIVDNNQEITEIIYVVNNFRMRPSCIEINRITGKILDMGTIWKYEMKDSQELKKYLEQNNYQPINNELFLDNVYIHRGNNNEELFRLYNRGAGYYWINYSVGIPH